MFDELSSGILNVNKYIKAYSGKDNPQFIEGDITIPNVGATHETDVGVTKRVKEKLKAILKAIAEEKGKRILFYKNAANHSESDRFIENICNNCGKQI